MCALRRLPPPAPEQEPPGEYRVKLGALRLHLNDVDDLVQYLRNSTRRVGIHVGDATADDAEDLREAHARELQDVRVVTEEPAVLVRLSRATAYASTLDESDAAREIVDATKRLLTVRRSLLAGWYGSRVLTWSYVFAVVGTLTIAAVTTPGPYTRLQSLVLATMAVAVLAPFALGLAASVRRDLGGAVIVPERRADQRSSIRQHRTSWIIAIATLMATAVISTALTYWQVKAE